MNFLSFGKFSQIEYKRMDFAAVKRCLRILIRQFERAEDFECAEKALLGIERLMSEVHTNATVCSIRHTVNTADVFYESEMKFINKSLVMMMGVSKRYTKCLLRTPYRKQFSDKYGEVIFKNAEADYRLSSLKIIPLLLKINKLTMEYSKLLASQSVAFGGEKCNFYGLLKHMENPGREVRKQAMAAWSEAYRKIAPRLDAIYAGLVKLRRKKAKRLGFKNYVDMVYLERYRFDYNEKDVEFFRGEVLKHITPLCAELVKKQAERLGVDKLKYYDEKLFFPEGNADPKGTPEELVAAAQKMYREMSPESGEFFDFMVEHGLFDLETKLNKRLGGYCTVLPSYGAPFIFSNFNGTAADYGVMTHEAGHCFNKYLALRQSKLLSTVNATSEVSEIHSMTMELFALPWAKEFFGKNTEKAVYVQIADSLMSVPYMACVDEFQHKVFLGKKTDAAQRRILWSSLEKKYMPWRDYGGDEFLESGGFWMQKQHIFLYPFYYIDYALAQTCAYEFYGKSKADSKAAWDDYVKLCRAGGNDTYLNLLKYARLTSPFSKGAVEKAVGAILPDLKL